MSLPWYDPTLAALCVLGARQTLASHTECRAGAEDVLAVRDGASGQMLLVTAVGTWLTPWTSANGCIDGCISRMPCGVAACATEVTWLQPWSPAT